MSSQLRGLININIAICDWSRLSKRDGNDRVIISALQVSVCHAGGTHQRSVGLHLAMDRESLDRPVSRSLEATAERPTLTSRSEASDLVRDQVQWRGSSHVDAIHAETAEAHQSPFHGTMSTAEKRRRLLSSGSLDVSMDVEQRSEKKPRLNYPTPTSARSLLNTPQKLHVRQIFLSILANH